MSGRLCILTCLNFSSEVAAAIAAEGWTEVVSPVFPARCGRPRISWEELRLLLPEGCSQLALFGSVCLKDLGSPPADFPLVRTVFLEQCFHLVAGQTLVDDCLARGAYLVTPGWLENWREHLLETGFTPEQARECYRESARELVLLDTGTNPRGSGAFGEFCRELSLPGERLPVGLDHLRLLLARQMLQWRLDEQVRDVKQRDRRHAAELAEYLSAMDLLARLAATVSEQQSIAAIEELFRMLFAPDEFHYVRVEQGIPVYGAAIPPDLVNVMTGLRDDYALTSDGQGFLVRIVHEDELLGIAAVIRLAYPEYCDRYLNMALAVTGVCGLAIINARTRKRLVEAEKMASLGMLVAGVAHEVNTPLGVVLTAATAVKEQSHRLASRLTRRTMTQSDLEHFLDLAAESTSLIVQNMERIARLTHTFRQAAVGGETPRPQTFSIRACIEDVISSMGRSLDPDHVAVTVRCDPDLVITSNTADWVTIFSNLLGNSLRHGFRGRQQGCVDLTVSTEGGRLTIEYRDDGNGLEPEVLARVFDPFFTTDMQQGMGLGMHLVYNIITHRLRGGISCSSQPGKGALFHIEVPV